MQTDSCFLACWSAMRTLPTAGEQQRLGMARLFFHRPLFGVLDECTNATSIDVEEALYQHARALGITLLTITQRAALLKYHDAELRLLDGEGDWELKQIRQPAATAVEAATAVVEDEGAEGASA